MLLHENCIVNETKSESTESTFQQTNHASDLSNEQPRHVWKGNVVFKFRTTTLKISKHETSSGINARQSTHECRELILRNDDKSSVVCYAIRCGRTARSTKYDETADASLYVISG